jgi:hypothetical protein
MRISGQTGNTVELQIIQEGQVIASGSINRTAGSPNEQEITIIANIDLSKPYYARLIFDSGLDSAGATPVWLIIDGKKTKVATFKTSTNNPTTVQVMDVPLKGLFTIAGKEISFQAEASESGQDVLTFEWNFGDGSDTIIHTYTSDGTNTIVDSTNHIYLQKGIYIVTLKVKDQDGAEEIYTLEIRVY